MIDLPDDVPFTLGPSSDDREAWLEARRHVLSATQLAQIGSGSEKAFQTLYKDRHEENSFLGNKYTWWGGAREGYIAMYALGKYGYMHNTLLWVSKEWPWLSATPDLHSPDLGGVMDVKTKCENKGRMKTPPQGYRDQVHVQGLVSGARELSLLVEHYTLSDEDDFNITDVPPVLYPFDWDQERADRLLEIGEAYMAFEEQQEIINEYL